MTGNFTRGGAGGGFARNDGLEFWLEATGSEFYLQRWIGILLTAAGLDCLETIDLKLARGSMVTASARGSRL